MTSTSFDLILIDPTPADLASALADAAAAANHAAQLGNAPDECLLEPVNPEAWARLTRKRAEGVKRWSGTRVDHFVIAQVKLAWWTDTIGRRHARVGGLAIVEVPSLLPPLVEVYPERAVVRRRNQVDVRVVCCCGQAGDPAQLGWMGEHCGPCHDRLQEGHSLPVDIFLGPDSRTGNDLCFLPAGPSGGIDAGPVLGGARELLISHTPEVRLWDLAGGVHLIAWRTRKRGCHDLLPFPDGRRVAVEERHSGALVLRDLTTDRRRRLAASCGRYFGMALSPDGETIAVGGDRPRCIDLRSGKEALLTGLPDQATGNRRAVAFTADGRSVLVAGETGTILQGDVHGGELTSLTQAPADRGNSVGMAEFSANGRTLVFSRWNDKRIFHVWRGEEGWTTLRRDRRRAPCWHTLSRDGSIVLLVEYTGRIEFWDLNEMRCLGSLLGAPYGSNFSPTAVAFSPDDSLLALATRDGAVRLWPWRQLLA
jgi:hypothetical protein